MFIINAPWLNSYKEYIKQFITSPREMGSIIPSSSSLCNTMLSYIDWDKQSKFAEIGAGNGVMTKQILQKSSLNTSLDIYEVNNTFITQLQQIKDNRVVVYPISAEYLQNEYDVIISGIPFLSLNKKIGMRILKKANQCLVAKQGVFILFQYTQSCEKMFSRYFNFTKQRVYLNFPPAWVYVCYPK